MCEDYGKKFSQAEMRIRKQSRNVIVKIPSLDTTVEGLVREPWGSYGVQESFDRDGAVEPFFRQSPSSDGTVHVGAVSEAAKSELLQEEISRNVDEGEESKVPGDQLRQAQEREHLMRHYVRRGNRKEGDDPSLGPIESFTVPAAASGITQLGINDINGIKLRINSGESTPVRAKADFQVSKTDEKQDHPSNQPEGSLLHTLYLQLVAAGGEGITLRELFGSFKKQTCLPSLASDWKEQVRALLKSNPHFDEVKGRYLLCEQLVQPKRRSLPFHIPSRSANPRASSNGHVPSPRSTFQSPDAAAVQSALSMDKNEGVQTRRKAYEKTIEAVLTESALEFQKMQQDLVNPPLVGITESRASNSIVAEPEESPATHTPFPTSNKKRKPSSNNEEDGIRNIRGSLKAMQAKILAETGVQSGVPCARKDDARKWRCPLMAMEGHTLCEHHKSLQERKNAKKQHENLNRRLGEKEFLRSAQGSSTGELGLYQGEKEDIVTGPGGAHAIQALIDLRCQVTEKESLKPASTVDLLKTQDDIAATNLVEEEEEPEVFNDDLSKAATKTLKLASALNGTSGMSMTPSHDEKGVLRKAPYERAIPGSLKALQARIVAESGGPHSGVRCARKDGSVDSARKWQCPLNAMHGHTLCEHHMFLKERKRARYAAAKKKRQQGGDPVTSKSSTTQVDEVMASSPAGDERHSTGEAERDSMRDPKLSRSAVTNEKKLQDDESSDTDEGVIPNPKEAKESSSKTEKPLLQVFRNAPKKRYIAAKKTASSFVLVKEKHIERESSSLIRSPTIPPLPATYGIRRKAVKNRSLLSL